MIKIWANVIRFGQNQNLAFPKNVRFPMAMTIINEDYEVKDKFKCVHGRRKREAGGGRGPSPWIFKHGTNIVDRGLKVRPYFAIFRSFFVALPPLKNFLPTPLNVFSVY